MTPRLRAHFAHRFGEAGLSVVMRACVVFVVWVVLATTESRAHASRYESSGVEPGAAQDRSADSSAADPQRNFQFALRFTF